MRTPDGSGRARRASAPQLGADAVISDRQQLRTYECDGLAALQGVPGAGGAAGDRRAVRRGRCAACVEAGVPFVARGSGTGLSGGALPRADGVLIVTSPDARILEVDRDGPARRGASRA